MKLKVNKNIRLGLIIIVAITTTIFSYLIYKAVYNPSFEEQTISLYNYNNKGLINYEVFLKPNNLYKHNKLGEGELYITEFVDYINANLNYEFIGEREAEIKGDYNIIAKVKGLTGEGDKITNIWEKDFPVTQYKRINTIGDKVLINENVKLNLREYNTFVKEIKEVTKINCETVLILSMNINLSGTTDRGTFEDSISPNLIIPLDATMFEITRNNIIDEPGAIEEIIRVRLPVNRNLIIGYGITLSILVISILFLIFFTEQKPNIDPLKKEINKIFNKHGDRLVSLSSDVLIKDSINVKSIEDLVKISDEIGKPILYRYNEDYKEINKFYILSDNEVFVFDLKCLQDLEQIYNTKVSHSDNN